MRPEARVLVNGIADVYWDIVGIYTNHTFVEIVIGKAMINSES